VAQAPSARVKGTQVRQPVCSACGGSGWVLVHSWFNPPERETCAACYTFESETPLTTRPIVLRPEQRAALASLEWLVSEEQSSNERINGKGRTTVLSLAIVRAALRNPGVPQSIFDHEPMHLTYNHIALAAVRQWLDYFELHDYVRFGKHTLTVIEPEEHHEHRVVFDARRTLALAL
jgi:hypothetical protein